MNKCLTEALPLAMVEIESPFYTGTVKAVCMDHPLYDVTIGNIPGATELQEPSVGAAVTRAASKRTPRFTKLNVNQLYDLDLDADSMKTLQEEDKTLDKLREDVQSGKTVDQNRKGKIITIKGLLYRSYMCQDGETKQLILPLCLRTKIMSIAHEGLLGGHLGIEKTLAKIRQEFYWPGIGAEVRRFCQSCDICQKTYQKGK